VALEVKSGLGDSGWPRGVMGDLVGSQVVPRVLGWPQRIWGGLVVTVVSGGRVWPKGVVGDIRGRGWAHGAVGSHGRLDF
jgi:hypothetical protein